MQYCLGISCIILGFFIEDWLFPDVPFSFTPTKTQKANETLPDIPQWPPVPQLEMFWLICCFTVTTFLAATQDIAVDGWAISLLSRENIGFT